MSPAFFLGCSAGCIILTAAFTETITARWLLVAAFLFNFLTLIAIWKGAS